MRKLAVLTTLSVLCLGLLPSISQAESPKSYTQEGSYCAAIRGNGELMPAHWGSMAKLVERYGVPSAMAGGSSASITMFLIESISMNKLVKNETERALLIKSIEGYFETMTATEEGKALMSLMADKEALILLGKKLIATGGKPTGNTLLELMAFQQKHLEDLKVTMNSSDLKSIINPEMLKYIDKTMKMMESYKKEENAKTEGQVAYRYNQIQHAFNNFGKFNTLTDKTLFFRPGLISFEKVADLFGRMGNFYAGFSLGLDNQVKASVDGLMTNFLRYCSQDSKGKSWQEIAAAKPQCRMMLGKAVLDYREEFKNQINAKVKLPLRITNNIGSSLATFPTTSIIVGKGVDAYKTAYKEYNKTFDPTFGDRFKVKPAQYRFGYWGNESELNIIKQNLRSKNGFIDGRGVEINLSKDKKSQKFTSLGNASWFKALSTSPAEPGLARILPLKGTRLLSAGGWNDLHPTLVLRAVGCKNIIYVTRRGGDSMFGQGVIRKLTKIGGFNWQEWQDLSKAEKRLKNAMGDPTDVGAKASSWSKLFNLSNPNSSFTKSLEYTDAVWCTNWDMQDVKNGMHTVVADGSAGLLHNRSNNDFFKSGKNLSQIEYMSQILRRGDGDDYEFSGCLLNQ